MLDIRVIRENPEKINELFDIIKRAENDFERLGIDWC